MPSDQVDQEVELAELRQQQGRMPEAEAICRRVLAEHPDHAHARFVLGTLAEQAAKWDVAVALLENAVALKPQNARYRNALGKCLIGGGHIERAKDAFRQALELQPSLTDAQFYLRQLQQAPPGADSATPPPEGTPVAAEAYNNFGVLAYDRGETERAINCYREAIRLKPDLAAAHSNLGNALQDQEKFEEAVAAYQEAIRLNSGVAEIHYELGNALQSLGRSAEAVAAFHAALQLDPAHADARRSLDLAQNPGR